MMNLKNLSKYLLISTLTIVISACGETEEDLGSQLGQPSNPPATDSNNAPSMSGTPNTQVLVGQNYYFEPNATDPDNDDLTFTIVNAPDWANFNVQTGVLSGSPTTNDIGTTNGIVISVSDGIVSSSLSQFNLTVSPAPTAAQVFNFASATQSVTEGSQATVTITRSNSAGIATVSYGTASGTARVGSDYTGIVWTPLTFNSGQSSRTISVQTIDDSDVELDETFEVLLEAPSGNNSLGNIAAVTVTIMDNDIPLGNTAPRISGNPATTATAGTRYDFTPTAIDDEGNNLTFSISFLPSWATFSATTGTLTGTPGTGDIGTTNNIVISVTDGSLSSALSQFNITISAAASNNGTATLNWLPPTANVDETPLTDLAGYKIYYGTTAGNITEQIVINNPGISSYLVENLPNPSTLFFAVSAFDDAGQEGPISNIVSKLVQ